MWLITKRSSGPDSIVAKKPERVLILVKKVYAILVGTCSDGRRDKTLVKERIDWKWYGQRMTEDHYAIIGEPGGSYHSHVTLKTGKAEDIANMIPHSLDEMDISSSVYAIDVDSTAVNTGYKGGAIRLMDESTTTMDHLSLAFG